MRSKKQRPAAGGILRTGETQMTPALRIAAAFTTCFAVGALLSVWLGLESAIWVPAGLVTSTVVATFATYRKRQPKL